MPAAEHFKVGQLDCLLCVNPKGGARIVYVLYPMDMLGEWIEQAAERFGVSIAVITGMDWDDDLTPWPAPGQPPGCPPFAGDAAKFANHLETVVAPAVEQRMQLQGATPQRTLVGVSLSGLFTLWQWLHSDFFFNIACLSGSFWYEGFLEKVLSTPVPHKAGRCFMLLGKDEPHSPVKAFRCVGEATQKIAEYLAREGVDVIFRLVPGNHYQHPLPRLNLALSSLFPEV